MRLFLNIRHGDTVIEDPEGEDFASLNAARLEAIDGARDILAASLRLGRWHEGRAFEIRDALGALLLTVPFVDAVPVD